MALEKDMAGRTMMILLALIKDRAGPRGRDRA